MIDHLALVVGSGRERVVVEVEVVLDRGQAAELGRQRAREVVVLEHERGQRGQATELRRHDAAHPGGAGGWVGGWWVRMRV